MDTKLYGALEAGGTKMVLGIADADGRILCSHSLPTRTPNETVPELIAFFSQHAICAPSCTRPSWLGRAIPCARR